MNGPSVEQCASLAADMGEVLASRPDLTPADMGERLVPTLGELAAATPERIDQAVATARTGFASFVREVLVGFARRRAIHPVTGL